MTRLLATISLVLLVVAATQATKYEDCGSKIGQVTKLDISDCPGDADTCVLKRGTVKTISLGFQSKAETKTVTAVVHGVIGGVPLPFRLDNNDGCKDSGVACPLKSGQAYTYTNTLDIKNSYPPLSVKIKWELQDDNGDDLACVLIPSKIE